MAVKTEAHEFTTAVCVICRSDGKEAGHVGPDAAEWVLLHLSKNFAHLVITKTSIVQAAVWVNES